MLAIKPPAAGSEQARAPGWAQVPPQPRGSTVPVGFVADAARHRCGQHTRPPPGHPSIHPPYLIQATRARTLSRQRPISAARAHPASIPSGLRAWHDSSRSILLFSSIKGPYCPCPARLLAARNQGFERRGQGSFRRSPPRGQNGSRPGRTPETLLFLASLALSSELGTAIHG